LAIKAGNTFVIKFQNVEIHIDGQPDKFQI